MSLSLLRACKTIREMNDPTPTRMLQMPIHRAVVTTTNTIASQNPSILKFNIQKGRLFPLSGKIFMDAKSPDK